MLELMVDPLMSKRHLQNAKSRVVKVSCGEILVKRNLCGKAFHFSSLGLAQGPAPTTSHICEVASCPIVIEAGGVLYEHCDCCMIVQKMKDVPDL